MPKIKKEYVKKMQQFMQEHPEWGIYGKSPECICLKKGNDILFYDFENIHGPCRKEDVFDIGRAIYTKKMESLDEKQKKFAESCRETILEQAETYGLTQGMSQKNAEKMLKEFTQFSATPAGHDPARHNKNYKPMTYGEYKRLKDDAFKVKKGEATILDEWAAGKESEPIPRRDSIIECSCIPE